MAEANSQLLDSETYALAKEEAELQTLVEKICAQLDVDHGQGLRALVECLRRGYTFFFPALRQLAREGAPEKREALAQAIAEAADPADPFRAPFLLEILSPLLCDPLPRIRQAARRVLRERLIAVYPEETLEVLVQWAAEGDSPQKALAAHMLGHLPPRLARRALIALKPLARSPEGHVRRAVLASLRRLAAQAPQCVASELSRWEEDPALAALARRVLDGQKLPQG